MKGDLLRFAAVNILAFASLFTIHILLICPWQIALVIMEMIGLCLCTLIYTSSVDNAQNFPFPSAILCDCTFMLIWPVLMTILTKKAMKVSYLPEWVISAWNLRIRVDVLQVPWEGFTLQSFPQGLPRWNIPIIHPNHTWRNTNN